MRRLPIYLLLDVSESMAGDPQMALQNGIRTIHRALMENAMAVETVALSVIVFAGKAKVLVPLTPVTDFIPPQIPIGCGTCISSALNCLMDDIAVNVKRNTPEVKGDWKPLIFLFSDGAPTDDYHQAFATWKEKYGKLTLVAALTADNADPTIFRELTEHVIPLRNAQADTLASFFKWVSFSIQNSSREIQEQNRQGNKVNLDKGGLENAIVDDGFPQPSPRDCFVITVRCQKTRKPYILQYFRDAQDTGLFISSGVFPVDEQYFELSGGGGRQEVDTSDLRGTLYPCPYCGNTHLGFTDCSKWMCLDPHQKQDCTCPWCGTRGSYGDDNDGSLSSIHGGRG